MSENLTNKVALVTGSSQGLGAEIAKQLANEGCYVYVNCVHGIEKARMVVKEILAGGGASEIFECDITDEKVIMEKISKIKPVDILVNNARLDPYNRGADDTEAGWFTKILSVNLVGSYLAILAVIDGMKERRWGRIINISSVQAHVAVPRKLIPYSASKAGMHALTRSFAIELAPYNITVNSVAPGMILTEGIGSRLSEKDIEERNERIPLHRGASCKETAQTVIDTIKASYITGETVNINGGLWLAP
ncbi:MAG: hypothetical protein A2096_17180 [Spirochaetes bacterium GWF1_41_5]|nr:MAG: hypothetical protein A2096_17180 [Spirochaetes bacterium GWF1_41_5]HBE01900.1 3-oxoacyl-ACP reductase [Spirochaetia bacterium]